MRQQTNTVKRAGFFARALTLLPIATLVLATGSSLLQGATPASAYQSNGQSAIDALGQTTTAGAVNYTSSAANNPMNVGLNAPGGAAIDTTNHRAYVADTGNNRVLVYTLNTDNSFPDYLADFVVGQSSFYGIKANRGSGTPAQNSLNGPTRVRVDQATGVIYVSDTNNNRVLMFNGVTANDPNATFVIGASDFVSKNGSGTVSQTRMLSPAGIAIYSGKIYITDNAFNRVLIFNAITANGQAAVNVMGQTNFVNSSSALSQNGMAGPQGIDIDTSGNIYVADTNNSRVMIWTSAITGDGQNANSVLGQTWFYSNGTGVTSATMNFPRDVSVTTSSDIFISDSGNNRVVIYNTAISAAGQSANNVLGQSNFTSSAAGTSPTKYSLPSAVVRAGSTTLVTDIQNNRVMAYSSTINNNGQTASFNLGQLATDNTTVDFYGNTANNPQNKGLNKPSGISVDSVHHIAYVADTNNNRVMLYNLDSNNNYLDRYADFVLGQSAYGFTAVNRGGAVAANTLNAPSAVTYDNVNQRLYISDTGNNRVLIYTNGISANGQNADYVLGQNDFVSNSPAASQSGLASPEAIAVNPGVNSVAVADRDNNRVLVWTSLPASNGKTANFVLGQTSFTNTSAATTSSALRAPRGVSYDQNAGYLFVADTDNNRVLVFTSSITANNQAANYVLGQSSFTSGTAQAISASSLKSPNRVSVSATSSVVYVSDTGNNRALVFKNVVAANNQAADNVVGQGDFTSNGAATTATGLSSPGTVIADGSSDYVWVADTENNRVTNYANAVVGTATGTAPADVSTNISSTPTFQMSAVDPDADALQYKIQIARDSGFTTSLLTYDQSASATGWSGQTVGNTYTRGTVGAFTVPVTDILSASTQYYWRVYAYDPYGSKVWTAASTTKSFTTAAPTAIAITTVAQSITAGGPSAPIHIVLKDSSGNLVKVTTAKRIYLTSTSGTGVWSAAATPFTNITYIDIPANSSGVDVYYKSSTTGNFVMTFSDATPADGATGLADATQNIAVGANTTDHFVFNTIANQIAGTPFSVTASAVDLYGNVVSTYNGTATLTSTLESPTPTSITFAAGSWTGNATLTKGGNVRLIATAGAVTGNSNFFTLNPGALDHAVNTPATLQAKAGTANSIATKGFDIYNNEITTGLTYAWSSQVGAGSVSPTNAISTTLTAANSIGTGNVTSAVTVSGITKNAVTAVSIIPDHYTITAIPGSNVAGANIAATITARTSNETLISNATDTITLSDVSGTLSPTTLTLSAGTWTGNLVITKTNTGDKVSISGQAGAVSGLSNAFDVVAAPLNSVVPTPTSLSLSANTTTGEAAQGFDQYNNAITGLTYNWSTTIGSVPATGTPVTFSAGATSGSGTLTVSVTQTGVTKTANIPVTVTSLAVDHFSFNAIPTQIAGQTFNVTILAKDQYNNTVTSYTGNGSLTYSAGTITPTTTTDFANGSWTGTVRVTKASTSAFLTYSDGAHAGNSNAFVVSPDVIDSVTALPSTATVALQANQAFSAQVFDAYGNQITTGITYAWTINDASLGGISPANAASTTFTALKKSGSTYVNINATQGAVTKSGNVLVTVTPGALDHFVFDNIPSPQPSGQLLAVKITAKDLYENTVDSFNTTANLTDLSNTISPNATTNFTGGVWSGYVQINGTYTADKITVASGGKTGVSAAFDVISNLLDHVVVTPNASSVIAGQTQGFSAQGYDAIGNVITGLSYSWSVIGAIGNVSPTAGIATTFTASTATGSGIVQVVATQGTITKQANAPVTVTAAALDHFFFTPMTNLIAGQTTYVTITAKDQFENTLVNFTNSLALSDDKGGIAPTSTGPLTSGVWTGQVSFTKTGLTRIAANYGAVTSYSDTFTVSSDALFSADMDQTSFFVTAGKTKKITGYGKDKFGNVIPGVSYTWSVPSSIGTAAGLNGQDVNITAANKAANGTVNLLVSSGSTLVSKSIDATVLSDVLAKFEIAQINSPQIAGAAFPVTIKATDQFSNTVTDFKSSVTLSDDTGSVSPTESGDFTNGSWSGTISVTQVAEIDHLIAKTGSVQTTSNSFEVKAGNTQVFLTISSGANQTGNAGGKLNQPFIVKAVDLYNNPMKDIAIKFSLDSAPADSAGQTVAPPSVTTDQEGLARATLTLGNKTGSYVTNAFIDGRSSVSVAFYATAKPAPVASVKVTPGSTTVLTSGSQQFIAQAYDSFGNLLGAATPQWNVVAGGGSINSDGLFTAGQATRVFKDTVAATVAGVTGYATVTVTTIPGLTGDGRDGAGDLDHLVLVPDVPTVNANGSTAFSVTAMDRYNQEIQGNQLTYSWKITGGGKLSSDNSPLTNYTADSKPGPASIEVQVTQGSQSITKSAKTEIVVAPSAAGYIDITSDKATVTSGEDFELTFTAYNGDGTIDDNFKGPIEITDSTSTITPRLTGEFDKGKWTGKVSVNSSDEVTVIKAAGDKRLGVSDSIKIDSKFKSKKSSKGGILGGAYNAVTGVGDAVANFVHSFLKTSTSYPETTKNVASGGVASFGLLAAAFAFARVASKGIEAIGRNPFARRKIMLSLVLNFAMCLVFVLVAFLVAGFIKFM